MQQLKKKPANLYESLFIIRQNIDSIYYLVEVIRDNGFHQKKDEDYTDKELNLYVSLFYHIILNTVSVLDEYNENFYQLVEPEYKERVMTIRKILKPVLKRLNGWTDLKRVRNELIAHPKRTMTSKDFSMKHLWSYKAPRYYFDLEILLKYLGTIDAIIATEFQNEMDESVKHIQSVAAGQENRPDYSNIEAEMFQMQDEVNELSKQNGRNYRINIYHIGKIDNASKQIEL
jgi:hypothetical protein